MDKRTVLVTGAQGFIGRPALTKLVELGYAVHAVISPSAVPMSLAGVEPHRLDLLDPQAVENVVATIRPSHLLHLAWVTDHPSFWTSLANLRWVEASLRLVDAFQRAGGHRLVVAGSCAEYDWGHTRCSESQTPLLPATLYGIAKQALRLLLEAHAVQASLSFAWGRVFFAYGPGEKVTRLVPSVIRALLKGERVACTSGIQQRDFLHVDDVASAFVAVLDSQVTGPINIASGQAIALKDLVGRIAARLGGEHLVDLEALPPRPGDPSVLVADVARLATEVGWHPHVSLERGLDSTIDWWRSQGSAA